MLGREPYFTAASIDPVADGMLGEFRHAHHTIDALIPERAALLLLDFQEYFFHPDSHAFVPSAPAILPGVIALADRFQASGRPLFATVHQNTPSNAERMAHWWRDLLTPDHPHAAQIDPIGRFHAEIVRKAQYDAFHGTGLEQRLREKNVKQVIIIGVMTHLCCESTARGAFMRGFEVFFPVDGTASTTLDHHRATLLNLAHGYATLCRVSDLLVRLEER